MILVSDVSSSHLLIFGDRLGNFFLPGYLTEKMFLKLQENNSDPTLKDIIKNNEKYFEDQFIFQQKTWFHFLWYMSVSPVACTLIR